MQERAKADADRLLAEARAEAERAHRQLEEELLEKKQEAVQVLAAASQQAEQEARNLAQARAHVAKVRGCIREALFQIDALLSTVGEDETEAFPTLEETSSADSTEEVQGETDENAGLW